MKYRDYIENKSKKCIVEGLDYKTPNTKLFPFQADIVRWALKRGRTAIFADTGLGKTPMQLAWSDEVAKLGRVLILAPLAVAEQTVREGKKFGIKLSYSRVDEGHRITITNYEMLKNFNPADFVGVVLDESSILKSYSAKTRTELIETFGNTPYRLACTATPSPNDYTELGNHSEFLGVKTRSEMLAEYFVHDMDNTQDWRLKGHAIRPFWRWVAGWAVMLKNPEDLGYDGTKFRLPPLEIKRESISLDHREFWKEGFLFAPDVKTLSDQRHTRKATRKERVEIIKNLSRGDEPCLIWCELNDEGDEIQKAIPGSIQIKGADTLEQKKERLLGFTDQKYRVLITKASIAGFGMNWQHCNRMIFAGVSHSYEMTYQAIRRCYRFGQKRPVTVTIISAETEGSIIENFKRKEIDAQKMAHEMISLLKETMVSELRGQRKEWNEYNATKTMKIPSWIGEDV